MLPESNENRQKIPLVSPFANLSSQEIVAKQREYAGGSYSMQFIRDGVRITMSWAANGEYSIIAQDLFTQENRTDVPLVLELQELLKQDSSEEPRISPLSSFLRKLGIRK